MQLTNERRVLCTLLAGRRLEHDHQFSGYAAAASEAKVSRDRLPLLPDTASAPHRTRRRTDVRTTRAAPGRNDLTRRRRTARIADRRLRGGLRARRAAHPRDRTLSSGRG